LKKVLIVDDARVQRNIIENTLREMKEFNGVEILRADSGMSAAKLFVMHSIDFVITDWNMSGGNGLELVKIIRSKNQDVPIIMLTSEASRKNVVEAFDADVSDYIVKGKPIAEIKTRIREFLIEEGLV
jgi:DNA-binding response OmpR family regulator